MEDFENTLRSLYGNPVRFENGEEMASEIILDGYDFYCPQTNTYVFCYNDWGSIAVYDWIGEEKAKELISDQIKLVDRWSAYLGAGGDIYDSDSYDPDEYFLSLSLTGENRDWIEAHFAAGDWYRVNGIINRENIKIEKED